MYHFRERKYTMAALATKLKAPMLCAMLSQKVSFVGIDEFPLSRNITNSIVAYQITAPPMRIKGFMANRLVRCKDTCRQLRRLSLPLRLPTTAGSGA